MLMKLRLYVCVKKINARGLQSDVRTRMSAIM